MVLFEYRDMRNNNNGRQKYRKVLNNDVLTKLVINQVKVMSLIQIHSASLIAFYYHYPFVSEGLPYIMVHKSRDV